MVAVSVQLGVGPIIFAWSRFQQRPTALSNLAEAAAPQDQNAKIIGPRSHAEPGSDLFILHLALVRGQSRKAEFVLENQYSGTDPLAPLSFIAPDLTPSSPRNLDTPQGG